MISKYGTNRENHPSFDEAAWCVASWGVTKGRVYGAPRMPKSIVSPSSSSHSYSVESSYPSLSYWALQKEIKNKEEEIKKKDHFIFEMKQQMDSMKEYLITNLGYQTSNIGQSMLAPLAPSMPATNFGYHGGTSNIGQGMLAPLAPSMPAPMAPLIPPPMASQIITSMGPTSPSIYQPTPRPLYPDSSYIDPQYHGSSPQQAPWLYLLIVSFYYLSTYLH